MSDTDIIQEDTAEGASLPPMLIPEITYRGSQNYTRLDTVHKNTYEFSIENNYTVQPISWGDFYAILALDRDSTVRNYVCAFDPQSKEHFRRMSSIEREEALVPQEVWDKQAEVDLEHAKKGRLEAFKNEYQRSIQLQIINGTLDHIPENLEADAEEFAKEKIRKEDEDRVNQELELNKLQGTEPVVEVDPTVIVENSTVIVDTITDPVVDTTTPVETTPVVDPILEPVVDPVVEPVVELTPGVTPDETVAPTVDTIEPTITESEIVPLEEAPITDPVVEPIVENPVVETPIVEPIAPIVESTVEAPVEKPVTTSSKKKSS